MGFKAQHFGIAQQAVDTAHPHTVADLSAVHLLHMLQAAVTQDHPVSRNEIGFLKQQQVHGVVAGG